MQEHLNKIIELVKFNRNLKHESVTLMRENTEPVMDHPDIEEKTEVEKMDLEDSSSENESDTITDPADEDTNQYIERVRERFSYISNLNERTSRFTEYLLLKIIRNVIYKTNYE
jgi:hypothetical protein